MPLIYAILAGLLPPLIWLAFWTREDDHPEPRALIISLFLGGMLAVMVSYVGEKIVQMAVDSIRQQYILWAVIEEITKFIVIAFIGFRAKTNDEPIDAMMYTITVALGFAALENVLFILQPLAAGNIIGGIMQGNLRFIGATLVHTVCSASIGFAYGFFYYRGRVLKFIGTTIGVILAVVIHASFNLAILNAGHLDMLKAFGWIWVGVVIMLILFEEIKAVRPAEI